MIKCSISLYQHYETKKKIAQKYFDQKTHGKKLWLDNLKQSLENMDDSNNIGRLWIDGKFFIHEVEV